MHRFRIIVNFKLFEYFDLGKNDFIIHHMRSMQLKFIDIWNLTSISNHPAWIDNTLLSRSIIPLHNFFCTLLKPHQIWVVLKWFTIMRNTCIKHLDKLFLKAGIKPGFILQKTDRRARKVEKGQRRDKEGKKGKYRHRRWRFLVPWK